MKIFKKICLSILIIFSLIGICSCSKEENITVPEGVYTDLLLEGFIDKDGIYSYSVDHNQGSINLNDYIHISDYATWSISEKEDFSVTVNENLTLKDGNNIFFIKIEDQNSNSKIYKINIFKSISVSVDFNTNGGTPCSSQTLNSGDIVKNIPTTLKEGYDFVGWDYDFSNPVTTNITVNAQWKAKEYTITIDMASAGVENIIVPVKFGESYSLYAERNGYTLSGYTFDGKSFSSSDTWSFDSSITVAPVWNIQKYNISYFLDNDDIEENFEGKSSYTIEDDEYILPQLTDEEYDFLGWYKDNKELVTSIPHGSMGDLKLYARWKIKAQEPSTPEPEKFTVKFNAVGTEYHGQTITVTYGEVYELPIVIAPNGYQFDAWKYGEERVKISGIWNIKSDVELVLKFKAEVYNIEYVLSDDVTNPNCDKKTYTVESDTYQLLDAEKPNYYIFKGWYTDPSCTEESKITQIVKGSTGALVLYPKFEKESYTITYDTNGGTISNTIQKVEFGEAYTLLESKLPGYEFAGWLYEGELFTASEVWNMKSNITLVASWELIEYKIEYDLLGGEDPLNPSTYTIESETITLKSPFRSGYNFVGWKREGTDDVLIDTKINSGTVGNLKFIAVWDIIGKKYSYSDENGVKTATLIKYSPIDGVTGITVEINDIVYYNGEKYTVTKIAQEAFADLTGIVDKVIIPDTLKEIGDGAFRNCDGMEIIAMLPSSVDVVEWTDSLIIGADNKHVADVIKGIRPKIGWNIYV